MLRRATIATALAVCLLAAAGCAQRAATPASGSATPQGATVSATDIAAIPPMAADEKRSQIATSFPLEAPLPSGIIERGEAQGESAWDYEIVVDAAPVVVVAWYKQFYGARSWKVAGEEKAASGGGVTLTLLKNDAQTRVTIEPTPNGDSKASGVLGLGTQVLQLQ